jgi:hypothetical protein
MVLYSFVGQLSSCCQVKFDSSDCHNQPTKHHVMSKVTLPDVMTTLTQYSRVTMILTQRTCHPVTNSDVDFQQDLEQKPVENGVVPDSGCGGCNVAFVTPPKEQRFDDDAIPPIDVTDSDEDHNQDLAQEKLVKNGVFLIVVLVVVMLLMLCYRKKSIAPLPTSFGSPW